MTADVVIRGGTLVSSQGERRAALAIHDGRIAAVDRDDAMPPARATIDADDLLVLPGLIDTHVHLRDPGK
ncbi:MAG: allantoinase, partial [Candidatus Rokubacteria bacterium]|nr:allantoinase [Candidatus Rokubacteria bacterium]